MVERLPSKCEGVQTQILPKKGKKRKEDEEQVKTSQPLPTTALPQHLQEEMEEGSSSIPPASYGLCQS
jgi:hypothetical protein